MSGSILRIHSLCSEQDDTDRCMKEFYARLLVRGYQHDLLIPAFTKGIAGARAFIKRGSVRQCVLDQDKDTQSCVFFHLTYHPRDPTSKSLQRQCHQHLLHPPCEPPLWRLKDKQNPNWNQINVRGLQPPPKILVTFLHTASLTVFMGPWSPPIWSRYWGFVLFFNQ